MNFPTPRPPCLLFASESPLSAAACAVPLPSGPPPRTGPRSGAAAKDIQSTTLPKPIRAGFLSPIRGVRGHTTTYIYLTDRTE